MKPSNFPEYENSYKIFKYIEYENSCGIFIYLDHDGSHGTLNILTTKIFIFFKSSDYKTFSLTFHILCFWEFLRNFQIFWLWEFSIFWLCESQIWIMRIPMELSHVLIHIFSPSPPCWDLIDLRTRVEDSVGPHTRWPLDPPFLCWYTLAASTHREPSCSNDAPSRPCFPAGRSDISSQRNASWRPSLLPNGRPGSVCWLSQK